MKDAKRYLCLSYEDFDENDYKHRFSITSSEQIFQEIKTYFIKMSSTDEWFNYFERRINEQSSDINYLTNQINNLNIQIDFIKKYLSDEISKEAEKKNKACSGCNYIKNDNKKCPCWGCD